MSTSVIIASVITGSIQIMQAIFAMQKQAGLTDAQITALLDEQYNIFKTKISTPLPDPDAEGIDEDT
jgi:hypothetical protein